MRGSRVYYLVRYFLGFSDTINYKTNTMETENPILERLKKLLRVGEERGATPEEAATALAMAQKLALKHRININEVDAADVDDSKSMEPMISQDFLPGGGKGEQRERGIEKFIRDIMEDFFGVKVLWGVKYIDEPYEREVWTEKGYVKSGVMGTRSKKVRRLSLIGRKSDVEFGVYVYNFLRDEFQRQWHAAKRKRRIPLHERDSFYHGVWTGLRDKLRESEYAAKAERQVELGVDSNRMQLAIVDEKALRDATTKAKHPLIKYVSVDHDKGVDRYSEGRAQGVEAGKKINIVRSIK